MKSPKSAATSELTDAFRAFSRQSEDLVRSYRELEGRVQSLTEELAEARGEGRQQTAEKERLAGRLAWLLDVLPAGVVVIDGEGRVSACNPTAVELLGEDPRELVWRDVAKRVFSPQSDDGQDISLRTARRVSVATRSLGAEPGQVLLLQDVTEKRALQDRLARLERLSEMGKMVASLAHQIRTPLASALLYASNLRAGSVNPHDRDRVERRLLERLRHLEQLITDMLSFTHQRQFDVQAIDLGDFLSEFVRSLGPLLSAHEAELEYRNSASSTTLLGSPGALSSALENLVNNALQAGGAGTKLSLQAYADGEDTALISLSDNGPGISAELEPKVFDPFFTTRADGTGLGLAIVRSIVQAHGGSAWLRSTPGKGTTVGVELPLAQPSRCNAQSSARKNPLAGELAPVATAGAEVIP
jgi:two-component system sensor histidine kinase FlrB